MDILVQYTLVCSQDTHIINKSCSQGTCASHCVITSLMHLRDRLGAQINTQSTHTMKLSTMLSMLLSLCSPS